MKERGIDLKERMKNDVRLSGYLFSHSLSQLKSKKGDNYIRGRMDVALDSDFTRVVPVQWMVMESRANEYKTLSRVIESGVTASDGNFASKNEITRVRINGNIDVNDYINRNSGQLMSYQQIRGGFIHIITDPISEDNECTFAADVYLKSAAPADEENANSPLQLKGYAFDFRKYLVPVTFTTVSDDGKKFFESQDIDEENPFFSTVYGNVEPSTVVTTQEVDSNEIGFGTPTVRETSRSFINWNITSSEINRGLDEDTITEEEMADCVQVRQHTLEQVRERYENQAASAAPKGFGESNSNSKSNGSGFVF